MNGWTKYYSNDTNLVGTDLDVEAGSISWSMTPLKTMVACSLEHDDFHLKINGSGNYWHSDDYVVEVAPESGGEPLRIARRIQKQIRSSDLFAKVIAHISGKNFEIITYEALPEDISGIVELSELTDKWLTLELDLLDSVVRFKILDQQV